MIIDRIDEEFLLFALDPSGQWAIKDRDALKHGLAGAWLAELLIEGQIKLDDGKVVHRALAPLGDVTLDWALGEVRSPKRPRAIRRCVRRLGKGAHRHVPAVMARLRGRGHVEVVRSRSHVRYPPHDPQVLEQLRENLKKVMFGTLLPDESSIALLAMIDGAGLLGHVFGEAHAQQGHLLVERLLRRDHRMQALSEAVRGRRGWAWMGR